MFSDSLLFVDLDSNRTSNESNSALEVLQNEVVAVIGYGNQGRAHCLNMRESGLRVVVGGRTESQSCKSARDSGFEVTTPCRAVAQAKLVVFALPDDIHGEVCPEIFAAMPRGSIAGFLHGFSVHFGCVKVPPELGAVLVAPKGPGTALRQRFQEGMGIPSLLAVHQGGAAPDETRRVAFAWAHAIGSATAGIIETTFREETETDLFGEQVVLCGGLTRLVYEAYETLVAAGYPPLLAYTECCHEVKQIGDLICDRGIAGMQRAISTTAHFGSIDAGNRVIDASVRTRMEGVLRDIQDGSFAARMIKDSKEGGPIRRRARAAALEHSIEKSGEEVRAMLPWLKHAQPQSPKA